MRMPFCGRRMLCAIAFGAGIIVAALFPTVITLVIAGAVVVFLGFCVKPK